MKINPYLNFNGDCKAAFEHYHEVLGGEIVTMMRQGDSPIAAEIPADRHDMIMHARLIVGDQVLMGSDAPGEYYAKPEGMQVSIMADSPEEAERIFAGLSEGGEVGMAMEKTFFSKKFGMCRDRFGTRWMVICVPGD